MGVCSLTWPIRGYALLFCHCRSFLLLLVVRLIDVGFIPAGGWQEEISMTDIELIRFLRCLLAETDPQRQRDLARSLKALSAGDRVAEALGVKFLVLLGFELRP